MQRFEYKVVPSPQRGEKARGVKSAQDRFALAISNLMNALGREGWEYLRAETLPSEERTGFTGRTTVYHSLLVFRRPVGAASSLPVAADPAAIPLLSTEASVAEAPRIVALPEGPAPKLGPATPGGSGGGPGRGSNVAAE